MIVFGNGQPPIGGLGLPNKRPSGGFGGGGNGGGGGFGGVSTNQVGSPMPTIVSLA